MSPLEFKRVAFSNEIQFEINRTKVDGNMVKRMASGGDTVEVRTNYKDEVRKKLQSTMFLYCNDFPSVAPDDAYSTLEVFRFRTTFVEQRELDERKEACPSHWMAQDNDIKTWIRKPEVLDAFTRIVLDSYQTARLTMPDIVREDTLHFKGPAAEKPIDRVASVVKYVDDDDSVCFVDEIKIALQEAGFSQFSSQQVITYVTQLFGMLSRPPVYRQYTKVQTRSYGFNRVKIEQVTAFDAGREMRNKRFAERMEMCMEIKNKRTNLGL
jgi:hypothetical protein